MTLEQKSKIIIEKKKVEEKKKYNTSFFLIEFIKSDKKIILKFLVKCLVYPNL